MARCKKCNAEIPEGKELCAECEQLNNESYLDSLLHTVASDDQITQEAENAKKIRLEKMRAKIDSDRESKSQKSEPERKTEAAVSSEKFEIESWLTEAAVPSELSEAEAPEEDVPAATFGYSEAEISEEEEDAPAATFEPSEAETPEQENPREEEPLQEPFELPVEVSLQPEEGMLTEHETALPEDFMEEKEEDRKDKYMLTPEEEAAFELDTPDEVIGNGDWENPDYDILGDDTVSDDEFDRMLKDIAETGKAPDVKESAALSDAAEGNTSVDDILEDNIMEVADAADAAAPSGSWRKTADALEEDNPADENLTDDMDLDISALLSLDETKGDVLDDMESILSKPAGTADVMEERNVPVPEGLDKTPGEKESSMTAPENEAENTQFNDEAEPQEDILDLINSLYNSEELPPDENDSRASTERYGTEDELERTSQPEDITDIFPDALGAMPEDELASITDIGTGDAEEEEKSGKKKKRKEKKKKKAKKPGIVQKLFGNIKTERSEEEIAQMKEKIIADAEAKEAAEEAKRKKAAAEKEEKKKKAAEKKAAAAKKKQEDAKKKAEAAKLKQDAKEKKKQEVQNLIDAIDEDEGRINRVGASIIFVLFAAVAAFILIGTNAYSYSQSIANAQESFEYQHYNEAYEEIAGLDNIKEEDETFILQVMTVMYTYKQLNSFNHYYEMGQYPQALDSLLKGLQRYDKYSALATIIEVEKDMDFVRDEILDKLEEIYSLTEEEAVAIAAMRDREAYTQKVYEIAGKVSEKRATAPLKEE